MKNYTITKIQFLNGYFCIGQDQENESIKEDLGTKLIDSLFKCDEFTITTEDIFESCNQGAIKLCFLEEVEDDGFDEKLKREYDDIELEELENYNLKLI